MADLSFWITLYKSYTLLFEPNYPVHETMCGRREPLRIGHMFIWTFYSQWPTLSSESPCINHTRYCLSQIIRCMNLCVEEEYHSEMDTCSYELFTHNGRPFFWITLYKSYTLLFEPNYPVYESMCGRRVPLRIEHMFIWTFYSQWPIFPSESSCINHTRYCLSQIIRCMNLCVEEENHSELDTCSYELFTHNGRPFLLNHPV
jgi:hypothetical protein